MKHHVAAIALAAAFCLLAIAQPGAAASAEWTIMVYLDADNDLEAAAVEDFMEMAGVGSSAEVNIVVQFDRAPGYDSSYGDWTGTLRYHVTKGMTPTPENALADMGEVNKGHPQSLADFVSWAVTAYPADKYSLVLWNHGGGWRTPTEQIARARDAARAGSAELSVVKSLNTELSRIAEEARNVPPTREVCYDETDNDVLTTAELGQALAAAPVRIDLIAFDACLMGMVEVGYELVGNASYMLASEENVPLGGLPYDAFLAELAAQPSMDPASLGQLMSQTYHLSYSQLYTVSVLDLNALEQAVPVLDEMARTARSSWQTDPEAVKTAAARAADALRQAVVVNMAGDDYANAAGMAVYFPYAPQQLSPDYDADVLRFAANTAWDEFLNDYLDAMTTSWVALARGRTLNFYTSAHVDLIDFCDQLAQDPPADDHGGSIAAATPVEAPGQFAGVIERLDDIDMFGFFLDKPSNVVIRSTGKLDLVGAVYDIHEQLVAFNDDAPGGWDYNFEIAAYLPAGYYHLGVAIYEDTDIGEYGLVIKTAPAAAYTGDDHGDSPADATGIALPGSRSGRIDRLNDVDFFTIEVLRPGMVRLATTGAADTVATLYTDQLAPLAQNDDGDGLNSVIERHLQPGTYHLAVGLFLWEEDAETAYGLRTTITADEPIDALRTPVHRFYNANTKGPFYTVSENEVQSLAANADFMTYEGIGFYARTESGEATAPVHRFFDTVTRAHFYTISEAERDHIIETSTTMIYEQATFHAFPEPVHGAIPLHHFYNTETGIHFYTASKAEKDWIQANMPKIVYEGISFYVLP
jgi:hypothetical protein